jgi:hypothetical protein
MPRFRYTDEQIAFVREGYQTMSLAQLAPLFSARFGLQKSPSELHALCKNHGIRCGRKSGERIHQRRRIFSEEQEAFIRAEYRRRPLTDLTRELNRRFAGQWNLNQVRAYLKNHSITSGRTGRFEKGATSWNFGKRGYMGANRTSFKKGSMPHTKRRLWSERVGKDGFIEISVPERNPYTGAPTRFRHKHVWLWECAHGKVPKGHAVIFKDGNRRNFDLDNLLLVTRAELLSMNLHGYRDMPAELKPAVLALARVEAKAGFRVRPGRWRHKEAS